MQRASDKEVAHDFDLVDIAARESGTRPVELWNKDSLSFLGRHRWKVSLKWVFEIAAPCNSNCIRVFVGLPLIVSLWRPLELERGLENRPL
jgi:hypothetical protein